MAVDTYYTKFKWSNGGKKVLLCGDFTQWENNPIIMNKKNGMFEASVYLAVGDHVYKFIVDGTWRAAEDQPTVKSDIGNLNNFIRIDKACEIDAIQEAVEEKFKMAKENAQEGNDSSGELLQQQQQPGGLRRFFRRFGIFFTNSTCLSCVKKSKGGTRKEIREESEKNVDSEEKVNAENSQETDKLKYDAAANVNSA